MTPTRRGRAALGIIVTLALVTVAIVAVVFIGGQGGAGPQAGSNSPGGSGATQPSPSPTPPPICPLSGLMSDAGVPARPALAIKVENLPASRPQTGLSWADIVYEEPVEGGITRFIAVYQCQDAARVEPVRSARLTDPNILVQFGHPLIAYSGGVPKVKQAIAAAHLIDVNVDVGKVANTYHRDPNRLAPHNLYTSTHDLYTAAHGLYDPQAPDPIFTYDKRSPKGVPKVTEVHVPFSSSSDVFWKWSKDKKAWLRFHGTVPHVSSDGTQFRAKNVIVQMVKITLTDITDVNGVRSPEVVSVGSGIAYVFRDGKMVKGTWERDSLGDVTKFLDKDGNEISLKPGNTWIELLPTDLTVTTS